MAKFGENILPLLLGFGTTRMLEIIDLLGQKWGKHRKAWALSFFFFGTPLIYFLRDGLSLAPNSKVFTALFTFGGLFLAFPLRKMTYVYAYNRRLLWCIIAYWILALFYLAIYTPNRGWFTNTTSELVYFLVILIAGFVFATISFNELLDHFLPASFWICLLGSLGMLLIVAKNPSFVLGMRASITFNEDAGVSWGNPHIYGRSAYAGLVATLLLLQRPHVLTTKLLYYGSFLTNLAVIGLTQSVQTFLALGLFGLFYGFFQTTPTSVYRLLKWIFSWRGFLVLITILSIAYYIVFKTELINTFNHLFSVIWGRLDKILSLVSAQADGPAALLKTVGPTQVDASAMGRVDNIEQVWEGILENITNGEWWWILLGNGYQKLYVDCPLIQTFNDLGVVGFTAYFLLHVGILSLSIREFRRQTHPGLVFICYFVLHTFVQDLVFGMPYDFLRWSLFLFMARLLKPYTYDKIVIPSTNPSPTS